MDNKKFTGIFIPRTSLYLWAMFLLVVVIMMLNWKIAIPAYALLAFFVWHNFRSNYKRQKEVTKFIENLTFNLSSASKETLLNAPMPLIVLELDGTVIWYNSPFREIFDKEQALLETMSSFVESLRPESLIKGSTNITREMEINGRYYRILGNFVKIDSKQETDNYILLLYFMDNTELVELKKLHSDEKTAVGIIIIDNYDELMQSMEDAGHPLMLAEIDKRIVQWVSFSGGILKKYERDKYLFVFAYKHLQEMKNRKFDLLDSVKEINIGNKIPVTLSMGFGINGESLAENLLNAGKSIDIVLGRGGDQVAIKDKESFSFFGGRTRELEKRTRVKARVIAHALRELVEHSDCVMIMGHENGDIDSLGASMGIYRVARNSDRDAFIVLDKSNPTIDSIIDLVSRDQEYRELFISRNEALERINDKTLLIVVDTHRPSFTECPELLKKSTQVVVIDHHRRGADSIQDAVLTYQETYASSTCELVTEILQYVDEKLKLRPLEAEALYAGIVMDTKHFTFKTGVRTFEAASFLRKQGVDTTSVKQLFQNDLLTYSNISDVVKNASIVNDNIAISVCPQNIKNSVLIAAKSADELLNLSGINAAFVLTLSEGEVYISGRSLGDINVQVILEKLGGGGHLSVAGAQLQGITLDDAKEKLKYAIIDYIREANTAGT